MPNYIEWGSYFELYPVSISLMQKHPGAFQFCDTMDVESSLSATDVKNNNKKGR